MTIELNHTIVLVRADLFGKRPGEINRNDGGRGLYWEGPDGHWLEIITRPYGSGG